MSSPHRSTLSALALWLSLSSGFAQTAPEATPTVASNVETKPTTLEEIVVTANKDQPSLYVAENFGGTRLDIPLREIPQSIRIVNKQLLQDVSAVRMQDAFDYVSGISYQNAFGGLWENYAVRGFTGDSNNAGLAYLLNGFASNRGFNSPRDTANVETIEFLKGPTRRALRLRRPRRHHQRRHQKTTLGMAERIPGTHRQFRLLPADHRQHRPPFRKLRLPFQLCPGRRQLLP